MIKKLHRKFILVSILAVTLVLFVIMASINILNYRNLVTEADRMLDWMSNTDHALQAASPAETGRGKRANLPFDSRSFSVVLDAKGDLISIDLRDSISMDQKTALSYAKTIQAKTIQKKDQKRGFMHSYRFLSTQTGQSGQSQKTEIDFVDCQRSLSNFRSFLMISLLVSLFGLLMVFLLICIFSRRIMRPVEESYRKQKRFITDAGHELNPPWPLSMRTRRFWKWRSERMNGYRI